MIDDPVVRVVQVSPSRSLARCVQRQVPWLRSAVAVHQQCCLHPRRGAEASVQTVRLAMEIPQFFFDKVIDVPVAMVVRVPQVPSWRRQSCSHGCIR